MNALIDTSRIILDASDYGVFHMHADELGMYHYNSELWSLGAELVHWSVGSGCRKHS